MASILGQLWCPVYDIDWRLIRNLKVRFSLPVIDKLSSGRNSVGIEIAFAGVVVVIEILVYEE